MLAETDLKRGSTRLAGRYDIVDEIGRGAQARTYLADDHDSGERVALKELDLRRADDWKAIDLFEREGRVLGSLDHPGIPRYIDAFRLEDDDGSMGFFLAQEFVAGESLHQHIEAGRLLDEAAARELLDQLFDILEYLHSQSPPVVHRDIKPANIIARPDGGYALVDFGAVQEVVQETVGGDTIVGTSGFLPPEQLMGRATPASDLYALGATVVYAMSGVHPVDVPVAGVTMQFRDLLECSGRFETLLHHMLAPAVEARLADVRAARRQLEELPARAGGDDGIVLSKRLGGGAVAYRRRAAKLTIDIGARTPTRLPMLITVVGALLPMPLAVVSATVLWAMLLVPVLVAATILTRDMGCVHHTVELDIDGYRIVHRWGPISWSKSGELDSLGEGLLVHGSGNAELMLIDGLHDHHVADRLDESTGRKLAEVIADYLDVYHPAGPRGPKRLY